MRTELELYAEELVKEADAFGRLKARAELEEDTESLEILAEEILKTASALHEDDKYELGQVAAKAYMDECEKIAAAGGLAGRIAAKPLAVAGIAGAMGATIGVGGTLAAQHQMNAMRENQLVEKIKQQNPSFRALYSSKTPRQRALISRGLRAYAAARNDLRQGLIPN